MRSCPTATSCRTRSTSRCPDMHLRRAPLRVTAVLLVVGLAAAVPAAHFPIFDNDPVDSSTGRPYPILPGTPLILPQPDGKYDPPIVDRSTTGDVDLVVRAGTVMIGPSIPPPATSPRTAVAGSPALVPGSGIPFTVAVSDGSSATATGNPLLGPEMDGIPVLVLAFADFDGDGVIGPTSADDDGVADDARELQESDYLIGRQVSLFHNGVAVAGGPMSRLRCVRPSSAAGFPVGAAVPLYRGAAGALYEDLTSVDVPDNGRGTAIPVRLVPVDAFDNVTDPPAGAQATLIAGPGLVIAEPDPDGDPTRETVPIGGADGVDVALHDTGGVGDSGTASTRTVAVGGVPAGRLAVRFVPGPAATEVPSITHDELAGHPDSVVVGHPLHDTVVVVVDDPQRDAESVTGAITLNGSPMGTVLLHEGPPPPGLTLPPGQVFTGPIDVTPSAEGTLELSLTARDTASHVSDPARLSLPVYPDGSPAVSELSVSPDSAAAGRFFLTIMGRVSDTDRMTRVTAEMDRGKGFHRIAGLNDKGLFGDATAGDGVFSRRRPIRVPLPGSYPVRMVVANHARGVVTTAPVQLRVVAP